MSHGNDGIYSYGSYHFVSASNCSKRGTHFCLPYFPYYWAVIGVFILCDSFFGDLMYTAVVKLFHVCMVLICKAGWVCCDTLVRCPDGFAISLVDVVRNQGDCLLWYHVGCLGSVIVSVLSPVVLDLATQWWVCLIFYLLGLPFQ